MPKYLVTFEDVIKADTEELAHKKLLEVVASYVEDNEVAAFDFSEVHPKDEMDENGNVHEFYRVDDDE